MSRSDLKEPEQSWNWNFLLEMVQKTAEELQK